jgi:hypothetical protein
MAVSHLIKHIDSTFTAPKIPEPFNALARGSVMSGTTRHKKIVVSMEWYMLWDHRYGSLPLPLLVDSLVPPVLSVSRERHSAVTGLSSSRGP